MWKVSSRELKFTENTAETVSLFKMAAKQRKSAVHFQIWSFTYIAGYLSCRMTDIEGFLTIYGHSDNLLNNKLHYYSTNCHYAHIW